MTPDEFRALLPQRTDPQILDLYLHNEDPPYVFEAKPANWNAFRATLTERLGIAPADVRIVGSGRFGFSMTPARNLRRFLDSSDIDVVVVNPALFDELWLALLRAAYPRWPLTERLGGWLQERRAELYTGYLTPLSVKLDVKIVGVRGMPVLNFTNRWFNALKEAARLPTRRHSDITGRLYRTWEHADLYHLHGLAALRRTL